MFIRATLMILLVMTLVNITTEKSWIHQQTTTALLIPKMSSSGRRPLSLPESKSLSSTILLFILVQAGDVELNPGPRQQSVFPCDLREILVTWSNEGGCCYCCSVWHYKPCIELCMPTTNYYGGRTYNGCAVNAIA